MRQTDAKTYWGVLLIIGGIIGITYGLIGPNVIQYVLFKHSETFLVITPFLSNILIFITAAFFIIFCLCMMSYNKAWNAVGILFLIITITTSYFANFGYYTLVSTNGITVKNITETNYQWDEIEDAIHLDKMDESLKTIHLTFIDGQEVTLSINRMNGEELRRFDQKLRQNNIKLQ